MLKTIRFAVLISALSALVAACSTTSSTDTSEAEAEAAAAAQAAAEATSSPATAESASSAVDAAAELAAAEAAALEDDLPEEKPYIETMFFFEFDSTVLSPEARKALIAHAAVLKEEPVAIRLEGHADERGTREYNIALGERRALAVRDFLRFEGVTSAIEVVSYGEERPLSPTSNESSWQLNRRVELK